MGEGKKWAGRAWDLYPARLGVWGLDPRDKPEDDSPVEG